MVHFNGGQYLSNYLLTPFSYDLTYQERFVCVATSALLFLATLGTLHLACYLHFKGRRISVLDSNDPLVFKTHLSFYQSRLDQDNWHNSSESYLYRCGWLLTQNPSTTDDDKVLGYSYLEAAYYLNHKTCQKRWPEVLSSAKDYLSQDPSFSEIKAKATQLSTSLSRDILHDIASHVDSDDALQENLPLLAALMPQWSYGLNVDLIYRVGTALCSDSSVTEYAQLGLILLKEAHRRGHQGIQVEWDRITQEKKELIAKYIAEGSVSEIIELLEQIIDPMKTECQDYILSAEFNQLTTDLDNKIALYKSFLDPHDWKQSHPTALFWLGSHLHERLLEDDDEELAIAYLSCASTEGHKGAEKLLLEMAEEEAANIVVCYQSGDLAQFCTDFKAINDSLKLQVLRQVVRQAGDDDEYVKICDLLLADDKNPKVSQQNLIALLRKGDTSECAKAAILRHHFSGISSYAELKGLKKDVDQTSDKIYLFLQYGDIGSARQLFDGVSLDLRGYCRDRLIAKCTYSHVVIPHLVKLLFPTLDTSNYDLGSYYPQNTANAILYGNPNAEQLRLGLMLLELSNNLGHYVYSYNTHLSTYSNKLRQAATDNDEDQFIELMDLLPPKMRCGALSGTGTTAFHTLVYNNSSLCIDLLLRTSTSSELAGLYTTNDYQYKTPLKIALEKGNSGLLIDLIAILDDVDLIKIICQKPYYGDSFIKQLVHDPKLKQNIFELFAQLAPEQVVLILNHTEAYYDPLAHQIFDKFDHDEWLSILYNLPTDLIREFLQLKNLQGDSFLHRLAMSMDYDEVNAFINKLLPDDDVFGVMALRNKSSKSVFELLMQQDPDRIGYIIEGLLDDNYDKVSTWLLTMHCFSYSNLKTMSDERLADLVAKVSTAVANASDDELQNKEFVNGALIIRKALKKRIKKGSVDTAKLSDLKSLKDNLLSVLRQGILDEQCWQVQILRKCFIDNDWLFSHSQFIRDVLDEWDRSLAANKVIAIPKWYHCTKKDSVDLIAGSGVEVRRKTFVGAYVSNVPEFGSYGEYCFAFDSVIKELSTDETILANCSNIIGPISRGKLSDVYKQQYPSGNTEYTKHDSRYWYGLPKNIPVKRPSATENPLQRYLQPTVAFLGHSSIIPTRPNNLDQKVRMVSGSELIALNELYRYAFPLTIPSKGMPTTIQTNNIA